MFPKKKVILSKRAFGSYPFDWCSFKNIYIFLHFEGTQFEWMNDNTNEHTINFNDILLRIFNCERTVFKSKNFK